MEKWRGWRKIQYESQLDPEFATQIASIPEGDKLYGCIQCGTCSAMCPLSPYMDYTPRQIIAMIRAGFRGMVLSSYTTWLCASCYSCSVQCPMEIKITDIMYAAKRLAIREKVFPKRFPSAILAAEFFKSVERSGRNKEGSVLVRLFLRTNPLQMLRQAGLGMRLWLRGRMSVRGESVKHRQQLRSILESLEKEYMVKPKRQLSRPEEAPG